MLSQFLQDKKKLESDKILHSSHVLEWDRKVLQKPGRVDCWRLAWPEKIFS